MKFLSNTRIFNPIICFLNFAETESSIRYFIFCRLNHTVWFILYIQAVWVIRYLWLMVFEPISESRNWKFTDVHFLKYARYFYLLPPPPEEKWTPKYPDQILETQNTRTKTNPSIEFIITVMWLTLTLYCQTWISELNFCWFSLISK